MPLVASLSELITAAQTRHIVSFPTDTVPGLAVLPECADKLYHVKGRSQAKPLILLAAQAADLWPYVSGSAADQAQWQQMAQAYWPGALTLVLPASGKHPPAMTPLDNRTLGIRVPAHGIAQRILAATGPLATTSANRSGEPALGSLMAIAQAFPDVVTLDPTSDSVTDSATDPAISTQADPAQPMSGQPSTVLAWSNGHWIVLRQGGICPRLNKTATDSTVGELRAEPGERAAGPMARV